MPKLPSVFFYLKFEYFPQPVFGAQHYVMAEHNATHFRAAKLSGGVPSSELINYTLLSF